MQGPGVASTRSNGWRGPESAPTGPVPSLTIAWAAPPLWSAGLGLSHDRLDAGRPEGDPGAVVLDQGWATSPVTLTGWPWRMAWDGWPGTLTARISASPSARAISWTT